MQHEDFVAALRDAYPSRELIGAERLPARSDLLAQLRLWLGGVTFAEMAAGMNSDVDRLLRIHTGAISYAFTTLVEQAVAVLEQIFSDTDLGLAPAVVNLPEYIRYGVATPAAKSLMAEGVRHRRAANLLGQELSIAASEDLLLTPRDAARSTFEADPARWIADLGAFVYQRTARDLGIPYMAPEL